MATLTKKRLMAPSEAECKMEDGGSYCGSKKMKDGGYKRMMDKDKELGLTTAALSYKPKSGRPKQKAKMDNIWADGFAFNTNSVVI
jgi:hypothetical protein